VCVCVLLKSVFLPFTRTQLPGDNGTVKPWVSYCTTLKEGGFLGCFAWRWLIGDNIYDVVFGCFSPRTVVFESTSAVHHPCPCQSFSSPHGQLSTRQPIVVVLPVTLVQARYINSHNNNNSNNAMAGTKKRNAHRYCENVSSWNPNPGHMRIAQFQGLVYVIKMNYNIVINRGTRSGANTCQRARTFWRNREWKWKMYT
jgi:hypothetical protein